MLKACMQKIDITPPLGLELAGYPHYPRYNEGAHDPLHATCMYLENCGAEAVMVTLDLLFISKKYVEKIRKNVEARCGIDTASIMISCTHTHSGPWTSARDDVESIEAGLAQPMEYIEDIIEKITEMIVKAKREAFDAYFASGVAVCGAESGIGGNRRMRGGPHDPLVSVLAIKDTSDNVKGVIVNYALHPTFIHEWSNVCTADFPCYVKLELEESFPGALVGFAQGTSGNQSSRYYRQGESYDEAERVGRMLGKAAYSVIQRIEWKNDVEIKTAQATQEIELKDFGSEEDLRAQVARDEAVYKDLYEKYGSSDNRDEYYLWQNANLKMLGSEAELGFMLMKKKGVRIDIYEDEAPAEVQVIRIGGTCVIGLQGEIFVEYGLFLKAMAGFGVVVVNELSNGVLPGYTYTPESLVEGGYEIGSSMIGEDFGLKYVTKALEAVKKVK